MPTVVIHELVWFFKKAATEEGVGVLKALLGYKKTMIHCEDAVTLRGVVDAGLTHYNNAEVTLTAKKLGFPSSPSTRGWQRGRRHTASPS
jgi:hypothetical protein